MIVKFCFLYINILLFFSCAAQGPASGGSPDKEGPILISIQPPNETIEISPNQKITLSFNELLDPVSISSSITLTEDYKFKVRSRRIIIIPNKTWPKNKVLNIKLSRKIRDYQKNIMADPIQLIFSTGSYIPDNYINGKIEGYTKGKIVEVGLFAWPLNDSSKVLQKVETDNNGYFQFGFLDYGNYTLVALEGRLNDFRNQIHRKKYAILTSDYISLSSESKSQYIEMLLSDPLERLKIVSVEMETQYRTNLIMNDLSEEIFIIDTLYSPGDTVNINLKKTNRLQSYDMPKYTFILPEITDTTGPNFESSELNANLLRLKFSEPIRLKPNAIVAENDSVDISLNFIMNNSFEVIIPNLADTITHIKLLGDYIWDFYGNVMIDSVKNILIQQPKQQWKEIIGGNILGVVQYTGIDPLMVAAHDIETEKIYFAHVEESKFKLENLQVGVYKLWAFEALHSKESETYFSGTWEPFFRAARFVLYPDSVDVRARWDVNSIFIDFE